MKIKAVDHIAINVVDINQSVKFYSDVMGFKLERRVPNGDNTLVYMKINDTSTLELFDHQKDIAYCEHADNASGTAHLAFDVCGIEEWNERLINHNVVFTLPLCNLAHLNKKVLLFKDPNGVIIELCEDL